MEDIRMIDPERLRGVLAAMNRVHEVHGAKVLLDAARTNPGMENISKEETMFLAQMAEEAGLVRIWNGESYFRLTLGGRDFLTINQDEDAWDRTKRATNRAGLRAGVRTARKLQNLEARKAAAETKTTRRDSPT